MHAAVGEIRVACDADDLLAAVARLRPHRAALAGAMHDPVRHAAQRHDRAGLEGRGLGQAAETGGNPPAMELGELACILQRAARRHGEDRLAVGRMDAERVPSRAPVPSEPDRKHLRAVPDQESRGFGWAPIEERTSGHVSQSGEEQLPRTLPQPSPVKSLGAETNHLPNIQGLGCDQALQNGPETGIFSGNRGPEDRPKD